MYIALRVLRPWGCDNTVRNLRRTGITSPDLLLTWSPNHTNSQAPTAPHLFFAWPLAPWNSALYTLNLSIKKKNEQNSFLIFWVNPLTPLTCLFSLWQHRFLSNAFVSHDSFFHASIFQRDPYAALVLLQFSSFPCSSFNTTPAVLSQSTTKLHNSSVRPSLHLWPSHRMLTEPWRKGSVLPVAFTVWGICLCSLLRKLLLCDLTCPQACPSHMLCVGWILDFST